MNEEPDEPTRVIRPGQPLRDYAQRVLVAVGISAAILIVLLFVWLSTRVWLLTFAGILLAIFLRALSDPITRFTRLPPSLAVPLVFLIIVGLGVLAGWLVAPRISEQFIELRHRLPQAIDTVPERLDQYGWARILPTGREAQQSITSEAAPAISKAAHVFSNTMQAIVGLVVVLFVGLYLAADPDPYVSGFVRLFPIGSRKRVREILEKLGVTLRHWLLAQLVSMTVVGILIGVGLKFLGVPLALTLGIVAGVLDFLPIVGPLISAAPAVLFAFLISPLHALYVVLLYIVVNNVFESHVLVPLVQRLAVRLLPALVILALLLGGTLFGFLGVLLSIPMAAAAVVLVRMVYLHDILGDKTDGEAE